MKRRQSPPRRFNFAIFVATAEEEREVRKSLCKDFEPEHHPFRYYWGYVHDAVKSVSVALVPADGAGPGKAKPKIRELVELFRPDHILVIGHGLGVAKGKGKILSGTVVVSCAGLYAGNLRIGDKHPLTNDRILPPSSRLSNLAAGIAVSGQCHGLTVVTDRDIVSAGALEQDKFDPTWRKLMDQFPRMALFDMESGFVGEALWELWDAKQYCPDYLVIKAASDRHVYFSTVEKQPSLSSDGAEKNKRQRAGNRLPSVRKAARFAETLIRIYAERFPITRPTSLRRLLPLGLNPTTNEDIAGVLHNVSPESYSKIAEYNSEKMLGEAIPNDQKTIFTVCAFEPSELWDIVQHAYKNRNDNRPGKLKDLRKLALRDFPHFGLFSEFAKRNSGHCFRVLLLKDSKWARRLKGKHDVWKLFESLNGCVKCWGAIRTSLKGMPFLTDYCIIGRRLVLHYHPESSSLVISEVFNDVLASELLKFKSEFDNERNSPHRILFIPQKQLWKEAHASVTGTPLVHK